jgi:lysozyme
VKRICSSGPLIKGLDIYHGDLITDINQVKASGIQYVMLKAFERSADPRFATRWASMRDHGIIRSAYDFFHPEDNAVSQAKAFCNIVGSLQKGDLCSWLDWEKTGGLATGLDRDAGLVWLQEVEQRQGLTPGVYGGPYFLQALALDRRFSRFPLWLAEYGVNCPLVPAPWTNWAFWQTTESGSVPGIQGGCDKDVFNGTLDQLKLLTLH